MSSFIDLSMFDNCLKSDIIIDMMDQHDFEDLTINQALQKLNQLSQQLDTVNSSQEQVFRSYINLYIQKQSLSQDFFISLCQHGVILKLFSHAGKHIQSIAILQMFNLLLANTSQLNFLVYIFSQPTLHQFLFQKFNIFKESAEAVQYYIQLLKTAIMKISSHGNNSLIKLFCNNRYPSFPLLTMVTLLGTSLTRQVLVKVTAHQCVLLLITLINQKQIGRGYLNDLQMVVFYFQLVSQLLEEEKADQEGLLKYLVDLIFALRKNFTSLSILLNCLTNVLIAKNVDNLQKILNFIGKLSEQMQQYQKFPSELIHDILSTLTRIINKIYFNHFINSTYITTLKLTPNLKASCQPNLLKYFHQRGEKISSSLIDYDRLPQNCLEKEYAFEGWRSFNDSSEQVIRIKQNKSNKNKSGFFNFFSSKPDTNEDYIKVAMTVAGLSYSQLKYPLFKLSSSINYQTSLYIVEQILSKHNPKKGSSHPHSQSQIFQIHYNDYRGKFQLSSQLIFQFFRMLDKLQQKHISITDSQHTKELQFQYNFMHHLRAYFIHSLCDHLLGTDSQHSLYEISLLHKLCFRLKLPDNLDKKCKQKLLFKMQKLQQQIHELTFQNDFKYIIEYVMNNKEQYYRSAYCPSQSDQLQQKGKEMMLQQQLQTKIFKYQFLRSVVDSSIKSIEQYIEDKWRKAIKSDYQRYIIQYTDYYNKKVVMFATQNQGFNIKLTIDQQTQICFRLNQIDGRVEEDNDCLIYFVQYPSCIRMKSKEIAYNFSNDIKKMRSLKQEVITKSILQYFEAVHNTLCKVIYNKQTDVIQRNSVVNSS